MDSASACRQALQLVDAGSHESTVLPGTRRLSDISRLLPEVSQKVLMRQLRKMEEHGLIHRALYAQVPPRDDYSLARLGSSLEPILVAPCQWGQHHAAELNELERLAECRLPAAALSA